MYMPQIGERIRLLRTRQNLSQSALAEKLSVSKSVVSSYETGVHLPPYDVLLRIAAIFGVSTDYLLGASSGRTINVDGLTDTQIQAIALIVNELKEKQI